MVATDRASRARLAGATVIEGDAYQHPATLEIHGDALTWRALRGPIQPVAENVVTTIHDVREARWIDRHWSLPGALLGVLAVIWTFTEGVAWGAGSIAGATGLTLWRRAHPRRFLVLELSDRRLVMKVAVASAAPARALVERIDRTLASGEQPAAPSALP